MKVYPPFIDKIVVDIYSKYAWIIPLKDKKEIKSTNAFRKYLDESNRKPSKIWVEKRIEFKRDP